MKSLNQERSFSYRQLRMVVCAYIGLPILVFVGGFLKWYFALPAIAALSFAYYRIHAADNVCERYAHHTSVSPSVVLGIFFFTMVWTFLGGMNGFWYQSTDWNCRNPIYFDLIEFNWPVVYEQSGNALSYYIGHWLPPALLAKIVYGLTGSFRWGRMIGRMALWCWSSVGLTFCILMIFHYLKVSDKKRRLFAVLVMVFFSGLDVIGGFIDGNLRELLRPYSLHLEWWNDAYQFTSITACVYWVFNQTIIPWLIVLCFMMEKDARNYVYYGVCSLLCGPFPLVGIAICMIIKMGCYCVSKVFDGGWRRMWKIIFSAQNMIMLLMVFPFVAAYILTNNALGSMGMARTVAGTAIGEQSGGLLSRFFSSEYWNANLLCSLFLEVGVYLILVFRDHKKDPMFYAIILIFVIAPYFRIGQSADFCMRISVPGVFILMLYVSEYLQKHFSLRRIERRGLAGRMAAFALVIGFAVGMVTPIVEIYRGFYHVKINRSIRLEDMSIGTFNRVESLYNFGCENPEETFFFRYLAK